VRYLETRDLTLDADQILAIYQKRWKVEQYHRSLKLIASLEKSITRTESTQTNHFVVALWSFVKIVLLKLQTNKNHYHLNAQMYLLALKHAFRELCSFQTEIPQKINAAYHRSIKHQLHHLSRKACAT
jgi:hypothetical protein